MSAGNIKNLLIRALSMQSTRARLPTLLTEHRANRPVLYLTDEETVKPFAESPYG
jgi:hypothetical protein